MNFNVTNEWQSLSEIMGSDYAVNQKYRVHNNVDGMYMLTYAESNTDSLGAKLPPYADIYVDAGNDLYFKVLRKGTGEFTFENGLYITEVND